MLVIRRLEDIRRAAGLGESVRGWLEEVFRSVATACAGGVPSEGFSLEGAGPIVFLEGPEDCTDLSSAGVSAAFCETYPEWVERRTLTEGNGGKREAWIATIVRNNSEAVTVCCTSDNLDAVTEKFLRDNAC